jgi:hypothetical protein
MLNLLNPEAHPSLDDFLGEFGDGSAGSTSEQQVHATVQIIRVFGYFK